MRYSSPVVESLLGEEHSVLDHGFVRFVDYVGSDQQISSCAAEILSLSHSDMRSPLESAMQTGVWEPFEQASLVFQIRLPIYIMGQLVRHRTAKLNSFSARYGKVEYRFQHPHSDELRGQSSLNKQVSEGSLEKTIANQCAKKLEEQSASCYNTYLALLEQGVCREQARIILPQNMYTTIYWKMDVRNLMHFLQLRLHAGAQQEIRLYSEKIAWFLEQSFPMTWKCFCDVYLESISFSKIEQEALMRLGISLKEYL